MQQDQVVQLVLREQKLKLNHQLLFLMLPHLLKMTICMDVLTESMHYQLVNAVLAIRDYILFNYSQVPVTSVLIMLIALEDMS